MATLSHHLLNTARAVATVPTAPFCEHLVRAAVEERLRDLPHVRLRRDRFGNLVAHYRRGRPANGIALVAHLDHPGFGVGRRQGSRALRLLGGVHQTHLPGHAVEFFDGRTPEPLGRAMLTATAWGRQHKWVELDAPIPKATRFAMWALPPGGRRGQRWVARACDDLVHVATMTALLEHLAAAQAEAEVWCLYTRAEEVGLLGALASLEGGLLPPRRVPVISLETSQAHGYARLGAGAILRVGDASSVFTPSVTRWLQQTWRRMDRPYQYRLMAGGTCEGTVFAQSGRPTGALCLALHNYHNMTLPGGIGAEAVHLRDWEDLLDYLALLAQGVPYTPAPANAGLPPALQKLQARSVATLPKSS